MTMPRFFFPAPIPETGDVELPQALAHHAVRVLRLCDGDVVVLFDGSGIEVDARLEIRGKTCRAALCGRRRVSRESPLRIVLVQALASGEKMDWIVQKAVELGAAKIIPVSASRSVLRLAGERAEKRFTHWRQVAVSACEQSGRNQVPQVLPLQPFDAYLQANRQAFKLMLSPEGGQRLASLPLPQEEIHILIGPEGGWTEDERQDCRMAGGHFVLLGPRILRTETAGLAAMAALQMQWGDF